MQDRKDDSGGEKDPLSLTESGPNRRIWIRREVKKVCIINLTKITLRLLQCGHRVRTLKGGVCFVLGSRDGFESLGPDR